MTWACIDDQFPDHPKLLKLGRAMFAAGWLHICGICYACRLLTDGYIPTAQIYKLTTMDDRTVERHVEALVEAGLWEQTQDGYQIHDYLKYNPSKDQVMVKREAKRKAGAAGGKAAAKARATDSATLVEQQNSSISPLPFASKEANRDSRSLVAHAVDYAKAQGYTKPNAGQLGKEAKKLLDGGADYDQLTRAVERMIDQNKAPNLLHYILGDLQREAGPRVKLALTEEQRVAIHIINTRYVPGDTPLTQEEVTQIKRRLAADPPSTVEKVMAWN